MVISLAELEPSLSWLNYTTLMSLEYDGQVALVPWGPMLAHLAGAVVALVGAYLLWMGAAERFALWWERLGQVTGGRVAMGCATAIVVVVFGSLAITLMVASAGDGIIPEDPEEVSGPAELDPRTARWETDRFVFTYPLAQQERVRRVFIGADLTHEQLRQRLGASVGAKVVVDLTEESAHHQGITAWTSIRVGMAGQSDDRQLYKIFVHELAHAFQFQESRRKLVDNARAVRFFAEGSAEYEANELVPDEELRRMARRTALAAWTRHRIRFDELADDDRLRADHDTLLVYTLGETWTAALVEACGADAPGRIWRAMGRDQAPRDLEPIPFWQDTLRVAECDSEGVLARWESMTEWAAQEREFLDLLPRLGGGVAGSDGRMVTILATLDRAPLPADRFPEVRYQLRVRSDPGVADTQLRSFYGRVLPEGDGRRIEFLVPRSALVGRRFQLQFGIRYHPEVWGFFERWQWAERP
jgi:hypothetical protein